MSESNREGPVHAGPSACSDEDVAVERADVLTLHTVDSAPIGRIRELTRLLRILRATVQKWCEAGAKTGPSAASTAD